MSRPFFSLVIPCYNNGNYGPGVNLDRLLQNLVDQQISKDDLEVIIADDHSPVPYDNILDQYRDKLTLRTVLTNYNFGPGNTRQKGAEFATGQWLCFADHDDLFYPNAFKVVKDAIEKTNEQYIVYTDFNKVDSIDTERVIEAFKIADLNTWVHGKFYNLDNFWKPYKLHFLKDLKTHEDLALGRIVECALHKINRNPLYISTPIYKWVFNVDSVSHSTYKRIKIGDETYSFHETHFGDFLESQIGSILEAFKDELVTRDEAIMLTLTALSSAYMSVCTFKSEHTHFLLTPEYYCRQMWERMKEVLNINAAFSKVLLSNQLSSTRDKVNKVADATKQENLIEWLTYLDSTVDDENQINEEQSQIIRAARALTDNSDPDAKRPFYSIVVACYNDGRYKEGVYLDRLLSSIERQGLDRSDLEVILADDCSPVSFDHIIAKHENKLKLKYIKTDYNFAPGNTRAKGVTIATGEWLCFADHDDIFYDEALKKMKNAILEKNEEHFAFGDFNGVNQDGKVIHKYECHLNWCHGKFYNKDNFWDKYGIHFIHDLKSHEDIAICTQVSCILATAIKEYTYLHIPVYAWTDNPQSVSHAKYTVDTESGPREFLEVFFEDYLTATGYVYLSEFSKHTLKMTQAVKRIIEIMCYAYFYMQGFQFRRPDDFYKKNLEFAGAYINECKKKLNLDNKKIYDVVASNHAYMYYEIQNLANGASGHYIPTQTFRQWLDLVSPDV